MSKPQRLSTLRLFTVVVLFLVAAGYSVWKSERFQNLIHGVSQMRLSQALGVPVSFRTVDFRVFPPSVSLADVRIGNAPELALPPGEPLLTAEEISIGGGVSLVEGELRLGRIRAVRPRIALKQLPDGRTNIPPGLARSSRKAGGIKVEIGSLLVQQGVLDLETRRIGLDGRLEDFAAELAAAGPDRYRGAVLARKATFHLPDAEPIETAFVARLELDAKRGLTIDELRIAGEFGRLVASGSIESFQHPRVLLRVEGDVSVESVERIFRSELGFQGQAQVRARLEVPEGGAFRVTGTVRAAQARRPPFLFQDIEASVAAEPRELIARIERARYAGGVAEGSLRIGSLLKKPQPMTLAVEASGLSLESFFADLNLPGTGLSGRAALSVALRWAEGGIARANGGGTLEIRPGPAASLVRGRFGIPTGGGASLAVVDGRIGFEEGALRFPRSTLDFSGGLQIGRWQPDFDFRLRSRDFSETDRLFQNFLAAAGGKPGPLGLGGSGEVAGHLEGTWSDPRGTAQVTGEETQWAGVLFGSARGTLDIEDGAFLFRPLRVYDGDASLSLEGMAAWREKPGRPKFDLAVSANRYPISRLLRYLDLDYPVEGLLSGSLPLRGSSQAVTGAGPVELAQATLWKQPFPRISARAVFSPGRLALEDLRAPLGGGMLGGGGSLAIAEKTFEARLAGDGIALSAIPLLEDSGSDLAGKLSFQLSGSGPVGRPDLTLSASLSQASFFGHAVPEASEPRLEVRVESGRLEGSVSVPRRWRLEARGDLFREGAPIALDLDAPDLASLLLFTPAGLGPGRNAALAANGTIALPARPGGSLTGSFRVTRARLDLPDHPDTLHTSGDVRLTLAGGRLSFDEFGLSGGGTALRVKGFFGLGTPTDLGVSVSGSLDSALLALVAPDTGFSGRLTLDVSASGTVPRPSLSGSVRVENGRYRVAALSQILDDIDGSLRLAGSSGQIEARAKVGGGEAFAAGSFGLDGLAVKDFRVTLQGRRITVRYPEDLRLLLDADLVATGDGSGNLIRGEVTLLRGTYTRDFDVTIADLLEKNRPAGLAASEPFKEKTRLEVRIVSSAALEVRNNVASLTGTVDLLARGTLADPALLGQIVLDEGGRVTFRGVRYEIESGTITFANARGLAPILDVRARAEVKNYDLVVNLAGTWPRLQTSFGSDPPLPDEQIVGLLLTGAAPGSPGGAGASQSLTTAATEIVGGAATGILTRPAQRLFKLERFQIEPIFTGSGFTGATTTVGKQINPNWLVTYSQPLFESGSREPIVQIEGRISQTWVLRLRRDENGIYLLDLRRRQRLGAR